MEIEIREEDGTPLPERAIGKVWCSGPSVMVGYFRDQEATDACLIDGWLDTGDMGYMSEGYIYIVGRAKDMIIINGKNHWPQDIEWAVEQLPASRQGDIAAFAITTPGGEETPGRARPVPHLRSRERAPRLRDEIRERVRAVTGMNCVIELVPPRTLPRTSSGKLSRAKARNLYLRRDQALRHSSRKCSATRNIAARGGSYLSNIVKERADCKSVARTKQTRSYFAMVVGVARP
jgi:fatty-acyl-CoA synthase